MASGVYRFNVPIANGPGFNYGQLLVMQAAGDTVTQIAGDYATGNLATRSGNPASLGGGGGWTAWKQIGGGGFSGISFYADWRWINSLNVDVGWHKFCTLSGQVQNSFTTLTPSAGPDANGWYDWVYWSGYDGSIVICYR